MRGSRLPALSHCSSHETLSVDRIGHLQHTCTQSRSCTSTVIDIAESGKNTDVFCVFFFFVFFCFFLILRDEMDT